MMNPTSAVDLRSMRVDLVGSLLRPQTLKDAFAKYGGGSAREVDLKDAQDEAIRDVVAKQVAHNLPIIVDGEFRRTSFMESFAVVSGVEEWQAGVRTYHEILKRTDGSESITHKGQDPILVNRKRVTQRLKLLRNSLLDDYRFTQSLTDRPVKVTLSGRTAFNSATTARLRVRCIRAPMSSCMTWLPLNDKLLNSWLKQGAVTSASMAPVIRLISTRIRWRRCVPGAKSR